MSNDAEFRWSTLPELRERTSIKWRAYGPDVLPLWVAEMDCAPAPAVVDAVTDAIARGDTGYPAGTPYAEALADFAADRWGWGGLDVARSRLMPDVMIGIVEVLRVLTRPGDAVVVTPPVYGPFFAFVTHADRVVVEAPLGADGRLDLAALADAFVRAKATGPNPAFLLCNPHNPTGTVHSRAELEQVATLAREHGVRIVSDEIHAPLVLPGAQFVPLLSVAGAENAIALTSASKAFNLAGLKAAVAYAGPEAAVDLASVPEEVGHGASHVAVVGHVAALRHGRDWLDSLIAGLDANRTLLGRLLAEHLPQVRWVPPQGTYLSWLDCRGLGLADDGAPDRADDDGASVRNDDGGPAASRGVDDAEIPVTSDVIGPARLFLEDARVAVSSGHVFGTGGAGHVRLNMATSPEVLGEALEKMGEAVRR